MSHLFQGKHPSLAPLNRRNIQIVAQSPRQGRLPLHPKHILPTPLPRSPRRPAEMQRLRPAHLVRTVRYLAPPRLLPVPSHTREQAQPYRPS